MAKVDHLVLFREERKPKATIEAANESRSMPYSRYITPKSGDFDVSRWTSEEIREGDR